VVCCGGLGLQVRLLSRNLKDLSLSFPELVRAGNALSPGTVIDGEIVLADEDGRANFSALQARLGVGRHAAGQVALRRPAVLLAFDLVRRGGTDLTGCALRDRRASLEVLVGDNVPCLQLIAQTGVVEEAEEWLELLPSIEGIVAKRAEGRYLAGQREWIKVKRRRTVDCVVIGVAGDMARPWLGPCAAMRTVILDEPHLAGCDAVRGRFDWSPGKGFWRR